MWYDGVCSGVLRCGTTITGPEFWLQPGPAPVDFLSWRELSVLFGVFSVALTVVVQIHTVIMLISVFFLICIFIYMLLYN